MIRSERSWARIFVRRGLVAAIMVLALAVYGLVTAGTQSFAFKPAASSTSAGHSVSQAMSPANGSINVAAQGPSHTLYFYWELENSGSYTGVWNGPLGIGVPGSTFSAPTIVAQGNGSSGGYGNFDIAVQGPSNTGDLYWDIAGTWHGPYQFAGPGTVFGTPGMVEDSQGNLQIAVQGPSNTLYVYWNTSGTYYGPLGIGGPNSTFSAPSMSRSGDYVYATVQGRNHDLESYSVYDGGSTPNNGLGTPWTSAFDISNDNTAFDSPWAGPAGAIFQGPSNALYQAANFFGIQLTQIRGAGTTYSTPSALGSGQYITAEGPSNTLSWYFTKTGTLDGPVQIGGAGSTWSAPSLIQDNVGNYDIAVQGAGNALYEYWVVSGVVHGPLAIGAAGSTFSTPN